MSRADHSAWMSRDGMSHWYRDNNRWYMIVLSAVITLSAIANYRKDPSDTILWSYISILSVASFAIALFMAGNTGVLQGGNQAVKDGMVEGLGVRVRIDYIYIHFYLLFRGC